MKYLVSVKDSLSSEEVARLRQTAAFPLEQPKMEDGSQLPIVRKKPHQLYEPTDALRALGLPLLDWGDAKWKPSTEEGECYNSSRKAMADQHSQDAAQPWAETIPTDRRLARYRRRKTANQ